MPTVLKKKLNSWTCCGGRDTYSSKKANYSDWKKYLLFVGENYRAAKKLRKLNWKIRIIMFRQCLSIDPLIIALTLR